MSKDKIILMPLRKHFPLPKDPEWKSTICLECGQECWYIPNVRNVMYSKILCTECAV